ncbi:Similar to Alaserpin (Manduca sexta), partial [Cotesia congregata]
ASKRDEPSNSICSPLGVNLILSMLYFGARGTTKKLLETSLKLPKDENFTIQGYQQLIDSLSNVNKTELQLATKLFTLNEPRPEFTEITKSSLRSEAQRVDLTNTAEAADIINNWCADQTNNQITQIIEPDDLEGAQMVLVNAIHLKSSWRHPFNPKNTKNKIFYTSEETHVNVPTMFARKKFYWGTIPNLNATFIKLPYKMGMSEIFGEEANFTGINSQSNLHVSKIIQKAYINVDELGSKAAAVTGNSSFFLIPIIQSFRIF